ncbi:MAG: methyltransferase domain-containing protein [Candidatus Omnitrophica bacterium]|nr:methyltransferase domain-containing protein [Candidatus Omnitrophota bacterium]
MKKRYCAFGVQENSNCKYELRLARYVDIARTIREEQKKKDHLYLLDIGCGVGRLIQYGGTKEIEWFGVDFNPKDLICASRRGPYRLVQNNICEGIPFHSGQFDVAILSHVLEHLYDPQKVVEEAKRVLKSKGIIVVGVPMHTWFTYWVQKHIVPLFDRLTRHPHRSHVFHFTIASLKKMLKDFEIEDIRGFRLFSASKVLPLENYYFFYRLSTWWGRHFPQLTAEVNCTARKS